MSATPLQKAGESSFFELVTERNHFYRKAEEDARRKTGLINEGMMFQRGIPEHALGNVDNGISVYNGLNYSKLPHKINWNLDKNSMKPIPLKAV